MRNIFKVSRTELSVTDRDTGESEAARRREKG